MKRYNFIINSSSDKALNIWNSIKQNDNNSIYLKSAKSIHLESNNSLHITDIEDFTKCDAVVVIGGDGFMLKQMHNFMEYNIPIYGINAGTLGFLLNAYHDNFYIGNIENAKETILYPLFTTIIDFAGIEHTSIAINEVSIMRETSQSAKISIYIDKNLVLPEMIGDGLIIATPAGSTAYNFAARGPILPLQSRCIAITPLSPFRPRKWSGAVIEDTKKIDIHVLESDKRQVSLTTDFLEYRDIKSANISMHHDKAISILFNLTETFDKRILNEQFFIQSSK